MMSRPSVRGAKVLGGTILVLTGLAGTAQAYDDFDYRGHLLPPPRPLPEGIAGLVRPAQDPREQVRVDRIRDIFPAIRACWRMPAAHGPSGSELTLRFSFKRAGVLIGPPRITYSRLQGDRDSHRLFVASVLAAIDNCLPLAFTDGFGAAVAGRPITIRFVDDRRT